MPAGKLPTPRAAGGAEHVAVSATRADARLTPWPTLLATVMGFAMSGQILHFFGWAATVLWVAAVAAVNFFVYRSLSRLKANTQAGAFAPTLSVSIVALLLVWTSCAVALWTTGHPTAQIAALSITLVLPFHLAAAGQRDIRATLLLLLIPGIPFVCFTVSAMWTGYPPWVAIGAIVSSLCSVAGIGGAAVMVNRNFVQVRTSLNELRATEVRLEAAIEQSEAGSRAKSEFLANMSHEIRTPLNGILGMAQSLEQDSLGPAQLEKVATILDSGKSLTALLNDVLDLSKIEAGKLEIAPIAGDLRSTIDRSTQLFGILAAEKRLEFLIRYEPGLQSRLVYDPVRVRQCLSNLLSNAIKFTERGRIDVMVSTAPLAGGEQEVVISIADTGIGMSADVSAKLFSAFTQADSATTRRFGGSGLGLAISRQFARLMGGDVTVDSEQGRGSTFRLTFKAMAAAEAVNEREPAGAGGGHAMRPPQNLLGKRVLLTDDNAINRQVIKLFLAPQGCVITDATNGQEALDRLAAGDFDILLLDVHMPVMDGIEAIARIRASGQSWSKLPVVCLTADAMIGDRERFLAMGMSGYVAKPVDQRELIAAMLQALGGGSPMPVARGDQAAA